MLRNAAFWHRNYEATKALQKEFETEGNGFISASLIRKSEVDFLPSVIRYLYHVRV